MRVCLTLLLLQVILLELSCCRRFQGKKYQLQNLALPQPANAKSIIIRLTEEHNMEVSMHHKIQIFIDLLLLAEQEHTK